MDDFIYKKLKDHMKQAGLTRTQLAAELGVGTYELAYYIDRRPTTRTYRIEAAAQAFFKRTALVSSQRQKKIFQLRTTQLVLERCEEARQQQELVVLYGPPGISKTFALREYVRQRADQGDTRVLLVTANSVTTPRALIAMLCQLLALPTQRRTHQLVEDMIDRLDEQPHLILVDEANHLNVQSLELMRHVHDMTECGMVLVGTQRLYDLFTNGGRKSQDLEQLWSRVGIHDLLPGLTPSEVRQITKSSLAQVSEATTIEIQRMTRGSTRRLTKLLPRLKRLKELNPGMPAEKLVPIAAGQIIA